LRETRGRILSGEQAIESLVNQHVAEIKAHIIERDGKVIIEKTCAIHGTFRRHARDQPGVPACLDRSSRAATFPPVTEKLPQPRHLVHQVRARRSADDRPDQPLQS